MGLIVVVPRGTGAKCGGKAPKCIKNAKKVIYVVIIQENVMRYRPQTFR